jgi:hypothetical protein
VVGSGEGRGHAYSLGDVIIRWGDE